MTNGYPINWNDLEPCLNSHGRPPELTNIAQLSVCGEKYVLNPIGATVEAQLPGSMCGYPRQTRITDGFADIFEHLWAIELHKEIETGQKKGGQISSEAYRRWKESRIIMGDKIDAFNFPSAGAEAHAIYIVNPPGVSPTARLKESIPGFPAGTEISLPEH
jgi:hypothetical protein